MAAADHVDLPLANREVSQVRMSRYDCRLNFFGDQTLGGDSARSYELMIAGPFELVTPQGVARIDPADGPDPAYLSFVARTVRTASAFEDGSLRLEFIDGDVISIAPYQWEPWQLKEEDKQGLFVVSIAGGGLAIWEAQPRP